MKSKFKLKGLDCANCAAELERTIQKINGIESANISFMTQKMEIEYDAARKEVKKDVPDVGIERIEEVIL